MVFAVFVPIEKTIVIKISGRSLKFFFLFLLLCVVYILQLPHTHFFEYMKDKKRKRNDIN